MPTDKAVKLLEKMRESNKKWKRSDVESLYIGYGFEIVTKKGKHDKVYHPKYPHLIAFVPRHRKIGAYVVDDAVALVDAFVELEQEGETK